MPELLDQRMATLVRDRLDAREPRRLPARFVPPPERSHRGRWTVATMFAALLLGAAVALVVHPDLGTTALTGLFGSPPTALPATGAPPGGRVTQAPIAQPGISTTPIPSPQASPEAQPGGATGGPAPGAAGTTGGTAPTSQPSGGGGIVTVPSLPLPPLPLPTPTPGCVVPTLPLPPLPLPTPTPTCLVGTH